MAQPQPIKPYSGKTPYEIRLELLQMAKEHLETLYHTQQDFAARAFDALVASNKATLEEWQRLVPKAYTIDEVTKKAGELYAFVLKKD